MTDKEKQLASYVSVMLATEIMVSNPKLRSMNDLPDSIKDELSKATTEVVSAFISVEKFVKQQSKVKTGEKSGRN